MINYRGGDITSTNSLKVFPNMYLTPTEREDMRVNPHEDK